LSAEAAEEQRRIVLDPYEQRLMTWRRRVPRRMSVRVPIKDATGDAEI